MDLLRQPVIASLLSSRHWRVCVRLLVLALTAVAVLHGLFGPQVSPRNLATVSTSIHWRGLLVMAIVLAFRPQGLFGQPAARKI